MVVLKSCSECQDDTMLLQNITILLRKQTWNHKIFYCCVNNYLLLNHKNYFHEVTYNFYTNAYVAHIGLIQLLQH